ncbi:MAG: hypothetical protein ABIN67_14405 [Ferruginibacter sp.]
MKKIFRLSEIPFVVVTYCSIIFTLCYFLVMMSQLIFEWILSARVMIP